MVNGKVALHIISGDLWAGAEVQVYNTLLAMKESLWVTPICILFNDGMLANKLQDLNIKTMILDEKKYNSFQLLIKLIKICKKLKPDIVHVHHNKEHLIGFFATLLSGYKAPLIRTIHGKSKVPDHIRGIQRIRSSIVNWIDQILTKFTTNCIIAVSKDIANDFKKIIDSKKTVHIYNAINIPPGSLSIKDAQLHRESFNINENFWIGTAARLVEIKNLELLIETGRLLKQKGLRFKISIFGDGPLFNKLKSIIKEYQLESVVFLHGFEKNMTSIIRSFDVFILSSKHEGLPMALLEAMSLETPVICTAVGGMKEVIIDGANGLLVTPDDPKEMADAVFRLKNDPDLSRRLTQNAKKTIEQEFSIDKNIQKLLLTYDQLLDGKPFKFNNKRSHTTD